MFMAVDSLRDGLRGVKPQLPWDVVCFGTGV